MIDKSASEQEQEDMHNYDMWADLILNDPDAWDIGTLTAHLDIEGITGQLRQDIIKVKLNLSN